ncbi:Uncharacterised protein [Achromobacter xylosoxidans]|nr:Uncharacterised protein [Achromobacter xylosoxidans]CUK02038.1 Uncharacterised protein [Achromobacter xylosoxidans]CUK08467.1 Uncharacterised protein [Achromobacter xylosoxidans]
MSFWHRDYVSLIESLSAIRKCLGGVGDFLQASDKQGRVILRHDVDRRPEKACALARLEHAAGVRSTYYFRVNTSGEFPAAAIADIASNGHEIGYHYEDLSASGGDRTQALARFHRNLAELRKLVPCATVSMHGAPLSRYDNQDLLHADDLAHAGLLGDAVASVRPFSPFYLTDTGGRWLATQSNLRDRVGDAWPHDALPDAGQAFQTFIKRTARPLYISTHPERWSASLVDYCTVKILDLAANSIKRALRAARPAAHS